MYKYRVLECPANKPGIAHPPVGSEDEAKKMAKEIVCRTHNTCFVERHDGTEWQRGSIRYVWYFDRLCFWNAR